MNTENATADDRRDPDAHHALAALEASEAARTGTESAVVHLDEDAAPGNERPIARIVGDGLRAGQERVLMGDPATQLRSADHEKVARGLDKRDGTHGAGFIDEAIDDGTQGLAAVRREPTTLEPRAPRETSRRDAAAAQAKTAQSKAGEAEGHAKALEALALCAKRAAEATARSAAAKREAAEAIAAAVKADADATAARAALDMVKGAFRDLGLLPGEGA